MFTFLQSNLIPNTHSTDLLKDGCEFLYCCLRPDYVVDAASRISDEIQSHALKTLSAADQRKGVQHRFGFPSFITELCAQKGVVVKRTAPIKPPIDMKYLTRWCQPDPQEGVAPADAPAPPPIPDPVSGDVPHTIEELWARMSLQETHREAADSHTWAMMSAVHRQMNFVYESLHHNQRGPHSRPLPHPSLLARAVQWPGDRPTFEGEAAGASHDADDVDAQAEEEATQAEEEATQDPMD